MTARALLLLACCLPFLAFAQEPAAPPAPITLAGLLERFAAAPGLRARFREEKHLSLLARPLVSEGTIHYARGGRMARHTTSPGVSSVLIEGSLLRMGDSARHETLDLDAHPVVRQFIDSFVPMMGGDLPSLEALHRVTFTVRDPKREAWRLELEPRTSPMQEAIARIEFVGVGLALESMAVHEVGGDRTLTTFSEVQVPHRYPEEELRAVFRLQDPRPRER